MNSQERNTVVQLLVSRNIFCKKIVKTQLGGGAKRLLALRHNVGVISLGQKTHLCLIHTFVRNQREEGIGNMCSKCILWIICIIKMSNLENTDIIRYDTAFCGQFRENMVIWQIILILILG